MTSRHTWSSQHACCSAEHGAFGSLGRFVVFKPIQYHSAKTPLSGPLQIAEMSSTVRCAVMANRMSQACSWRSV